MQEGIRLPIGIEFRKGRREMLLAGRAVRHVREQLLLKGRNRKQDCGPEGRVGRRERALRQRTPARTASRTDRHTASDRGD